VSTVGRFTEGFTKAKLVKADLHASA